MRSTRTRGDIVTGRADWYRIENKGDDSALVYIYDEIGYFNITASDFAKDLNALKAKQITLHLNSPGGEVFDGIAIMNALRNHPATITVRIDGLAASVASVIAMAGDKIYIAPEAQMMIHDANGMAIGNAKDMRTLAALLDKCSDTIAGVYAARAGGEVDTWRALMREESWYNAEEAVAVGLADEIFDSLPGKKGPGVPPAKKPKQALADGEPVGDARGSWDLSVFRYAGRGEAPEPTAVVMPDIPAAAEPDDLPVHAVWSRDLVTTPVDCAAHGVVDQTNDDPWADMTGTLLTSAQAGASTKIVTSDVIDDLLTAFRGQL
jgi:ATP-dependent protease ClpP protease subunit